jgi:beta-phosphoglucomutase family hydrolase
MSALVREIAVGGNARQRVLLPGGVRACLFDLDGVLTDTAGLHGQAWKETFDAFLRSRALEEGRPFVPFEPGDYEEYVNGRERFEGVRSFLDSRGIRLPEGSPDDPPGVASVGGIGNQKNALVLDMIGREGVRAYEGSVRFVGAAREAGLGCAVVSASANCHEVLRAAEIEDLFHARVDGLVAKQEGLRGKPAPDTFLAAARRLGTAPRDAAVFEDALAGVGAGRAGGFGLVVGVDRVGQTAELLSSGADLVVCDLDELLATP